LQEFFWDLQDWLEEADASHPLHSLSLGLDWKGISQLITFDEKSRYVEAQYAVTCDTLDALIETAKELDGGRFLRYPWDPSSEHLEHTLEAVGHLLDFTDLIEEDLPKIMEEVCSAVSAVRAILDGRGLGYRLELPTGGELPPDFKDPQCSVVTVTHSCLQQRHLYVSSVSSRSAFCN
jgi:hypothetical protein